jgi:hypothetical protein
MFEKSINPEAFLKVMQYTAFYGEGLLTLPQTPKFSAVRDSIL